ncbi:hypothetical protein FRX31_023433 [Thalictrum thalictroides]|uniref:Uncharacterized protein n=1 Tax=Thalictrum thalictroides TaxID=46969 RepID=A0A7J6VS16_THATH|nr:hypothetical protein FRX31_023433 [Thalictrum thalictroides]
MTALELPKNTQDALEEEVPVYSVVKNENRSVLKVKAPPTSKCKGVASPTVKDTPTRTRFTRSQGRDRMKAVVSGKRQVVELIDLDKSDKAPRSLDANAELATQLQLEKD